MRITLPLLLLALLVSIGCNKSSETEQTDAASDTTSPAQNPPSEGLAADAPDSTEPQVVELNAQQLLDARLSQELLNQGWVRLFDNQSLFGWQMVGAANWSVQDSMITVSEGQRSYLCTTFQISDFEMLVDFKSEPQTNSGIFLRTGPQPEDVQTQCLELNIAPPNNPFPSGSFVQRKRLAPKDLGEFDATAWHTYHIRLEGNQVVVKLDDVEIMNFQDDLISPSGHISLQHNSGAVTFRNILLRPIHSEELSTGSDWKSDWEKKTKEGANLEVVGDEKGLHLTGGLGQLQSKKDFGDFFLHATYTLARPEVNSGIFFRCIRDNLLDGYECQVNHATIGGDPLLPGDAGAGAIFRRQNARIVVGDGSSKTHISILASGNQLSTWVDGIQTADFQDQRDRDDNPRRGLRLEAGPISLQAHDPETDATYHHIQVSRIVTDASDGVASDGVTPPPE